jgi:hypothetical protein
MSSGVARSGILRVVSPDELTAQEAANDAIRVTAEDAARDVETWHNSLAGFIEGEFSRFQRHRDGANGWSERLQDAMRVFKGEYSPTKLAEIRKFGGSEVYARLVATKCRGASSLLRDVYLNTEKPWGLKPTPEPSLPDNIIENIKQLVEVEVGTLQRLGQPVDPAMIRDRIESLMNAAMMAATKKARTEAKKAQLRLDDILVEGGFYEALSEFLIDIPLFPFACMKGPVVRVVPQVTWENGRAIKKNTPKMFWYRTSPFDVWWTPGVANIADAAVIERSRLTRADLNQMLGLPGYNEASIRAVLQEYGKSGYVATSSGANDTTRAMSESREDPRMNESGMIDMLEYHGYVQGALLLDQVGIDPATVPDPDKDYFVTCYKVNRHILKVQVSPSLRERAPYYITSFEKVPGTVVGNALPDILADIQDSANASLRSLNNNMAMASGPQVVINDDRISPSTDGDQLYPWKRWHIENDPMGSSSTNEKPIDFFQPDSRAQELLAVYEKFTQIGDELSAIPRYMSGSGNAGGAGRTASGLAMLMGNAAKILQTVAANIDGDVIKPSVSELYDMIMLTDETGILRGDESIDVMGVNVAIQRETQRQRQLEFLQMTANPIDAPIMGVEGRSELLRAISQDIGLDGSKVVPPEEEIRAKAQQPPPGPPGAGGAPPGGGPTAPALPPTGQQGPAPQEPQGPQTNVVGP